MKNHFREITVISGKLVTVCTGYIAFALYLSLTYLFFTSNIKNKKSQFFYRYSKKLRFISSRSTYSEPYFSKFAGYRSATFCKGLYQTTFSVNFSS